MIYSEFKRKFSMSMHKNMKIRMGEMSFTEDFINDDCGDLYPVIRKSDDCDEGVNLNRYVIAKGSVQRLFCRFFPYASYELDAEIVSGETGFAFRLPTAESLIFIKDRKIVYSSEDKRLEIPFPEFVTGNESIIVSCRPGYFDIYFRINSNPEYIGTFEDDKFMDSNSYSVFKDGYVDLYASGNVVVGKVLSYLDNHISIADLRPVKYENGEVLFENGRVFFTATSRMQEGGFQVVYSWIPGTEEFEYTGALFFDCGDGKWRNYLASALVYNRDNGKWYVWTSSFEHKHILAFGELEGEIRYGINVIDVDFMPVAAEGDSLTDFPGFKGDEDPDFYFDKERNKWVLGICRLVPSDDVFQYAYFFYESDNPFYGYEFIGRGPEGCETGGSFVNLNGEMYFVCGNDFKVKSDYRIYSKTGVKSMKFNYPDGGFRGWGCVIPVKQGSRTRLYMLAFDRHKASSYGWSYGNFYCFEADGV